MLGTPILYLPLCLWSCSVFFFSVSISCFHRTVGSVTKSYQTRLNMWSIIASTRKTVLSCNLFRPTLLLLSYPKTPTHSIHPITQCTPAILLMVLRLPLLSLRSNLCDILNHPYSNCERHMKKNHNSFWNRQSYVERVCTFPPCLFVPWA